MLEHSKFEVNFRYENELVFLDIAGFLDAHTAPDFENALKNAILDGNKRIIVNFKRLDYISSAGLGVFMAFIEDLRKDNGDIKLAEMSDKVFSVFDLLGFPMLFDIDSDERISREKFMMKILNENVNKKI